MSAALALALVHPPHAVAAAAAPTPSDMGVCFLYGFTWFYGLKLFLKHLFSPILFFLGSMFLLTRMGVLPESLGRGVRRIRRAVRAQGVEGPLA